MKHPKQFGKYYLLERINVGGMAEVFRGMTYGAAGFERLIAIKRILPSIAEDKEFIDMFIAEAKIAVQLNHENIAQIFELGVAEGTHYIALEHVHGRDLRSVFSRCRSPEPMPIAHACFIVMKICEGLDYAHNKRGASGARMELIHRDVSPQNMLVSFDGSVKLIDFGIAKAAGTRTTTQAGILKGKFGYMSPEQVRGFAVDRRSDVFSCGIVLYELLTGERVFVGESDFSTLEKVRNVEILPPSTYNRRIPDELERIVLKALVRDPDERYQHAIDLHDELQAFVYTAGEICSRNELSSWLKTLFHAELVEENAKLEAYRQFQPDVEVHGGLAGATMPSVPQFRAASSPAESRDGSADELSWDDDELDTQIYANEADAVAQASETSGSAVEEKINVQSSAYSLAPQENSHQPHRNARRTKGIWIGVSAVAAVFVLGVGAMIGMYLVSAIAETTPPLSRVAVVSDGGGYQATSAYTAPQLAGTGFDLSVEPQHVSPRVSVKIDGRLYKLAPPLRARFVSPGEHWIDVVGPSGFRANRQKVFVRYDEVKSVVVVLRAQEVNATFRSSPRKVDVTLVSNGHKEHLGVTPVTYRFDLAKHYDVMFRRAGYVSRTQPVVLSANHTQEIAVRLRRERESRDLVANGEAGTGTLGLGSKPNGCKIFINGQSSGRTPRRSIPLKVGKHRVTLVCVDHNVTDSFRVTVTANSHQRVLKDYMQQIEPRPKDAGPKP